MPIRSWIPGRHGSVRHGGRVLDQRFHATRRFGQREDAHGAQQPEGLCLTAAHP
jgi:hypothetical protein